MIQLISAGAGAGLFLFFAVASFVSVREREPVAARRFAVSAVVSSLPFFLTAFLPFSGKLLVFLVLMVLVLAAILLFLIPFGRHPEYRQEVPAKRIDERDTMFSRNELMPGSKNYEDYYRRHPEKKVLDDRFRKNAGLLQKGSTQFDPVYFASADASFETIAALRDFVEGSVADETLPVDPGRITTYVKNWSKKLGATDCGITELKDYHLYSVGGRGERYGKAFVRRHRYAIAFTVEMAQEMLQTAPAATVVMESGQQYLASGHVALQVARFIRNLGYEARAHIDGNYEVVCPLVARDAGLGEIGRMGLLMTPRQGPRVRISVVTTNMPLLTDQPLHDFSFIDACVYCKKCAEACPSRAISFNDRKVINGSLRWQINQESCFTFWTLAGTDCGRCISVCPYAHPDNGLHNLVRLGMRRSGLFRRAALQADDLYYGRKPAPKPIPENLQV